MNNNNNNKQICMRRKVVTSEALGPGSVLVSRERKESLREEECLKPKLDYWYFQFINNRVSSQLLNKSMVCGFLTDIFLTFLLHSQKKTQHSEKLYRNSSCAFFWRSSSISFFIRAISFRISSSSFCNFISFIFSSYTYAYIIAASKQLFRVNKVYLLINYILHINTYDRN